MSKFKLGDRVQLTATTKEMQVNYNYWGSLNKGHVGIITVIGNKYHKVNNEGAGCYIDKSQLKLVTTELDIEDMQNVIDYLTKEIERLREEQGDILW